jgi:hypothetical protein
MAPATAAPGAALWWRVRMTMIKKDALLRRDVQRLVEPEGQHRFGRHLD